jgi:thiol-disulfide isomerase/thioredoxin
MSWTARAMLLAVLLAGPLTQASCSTAARWPAPRGPTWTDVSGVQRNPLNTSDHVATVLLFIAPDCPISNGYAREITRIASAYEHKGVALYAIHSDPRVSSEAARKHASEYGYGFPVLLDPNQTLAHHVRATVTPEAAVLDRAGNVVYLGRIDDTFYSFGRRRDTPTTHELRDALVAVIEGRPVATATAPPIGCEIPPPLTNANANSRGD